MALAPQVEPASFINKLFRFFSLPAVFVKFLIMRAGKLSLGL